VDGQPTLKSGDVVLTLQARPDGRIGALVQGRLALQFRLIHDADGRPYLWLSNRAFALDP
ncbi:MAG: hypothetical protein ACREKM_04745, partial [Longimicrobiales bacterium]